MQANKSTSMKTAPTFEIKIAVIGPVSAGKSTLINALLIGKYSEVSIKRTTAGINFFRLHPIPKDPSSVSSNDSGGNNKKKASSSSTSTAWSLVPDKVDAEDDILKQISTDNKTFRELNQVQERPFDIEGVELCETRSDTKMVIIDVPGLNEAESSSKYRDYIQNTWKTFDCVILVMDARHGVNTEEQVDLLEFTKRNMKEKKDLPVIILFNKVDELNDEEKNDIVKEARAKIESVFEMEPSKNMVKKIIDKPIVSKGGVQKNRKNDKFVPIFLPISARNGYVYRLAPVVDMERFKKLEKDLVESLGKDQIGLRQWKKLSDAEKYKEAYEAISDPEVYEEGLKTSNFESFIKILSHCVAGDEIQTNLIKMQMDVEMKSLDGRKGLAERVRRLYEKMSAFGEKVETKPLQNAFWKAFGTLENTMINPTELLGTLRHSLFSVPLDELIEYHDIVVTSGWKEEANRAIERAKIYLNRYVDAVLPMVEKHAQNPISPYPLSQMLVMAGNLHFNEHFGLLKTIIEVTYGRMMMMGSQEWYCFACKKTVKEFHYNYGGTCYASVGESKCPYKNCSGILRLSSTSSSQYALSLYCGDCGKYFQCASQIISSQSKGCFRFINGKWTIPSKTVSAIPDDSNVPPSSPKHYGHLFWKFCEWMERLEKNH